MIMSTPVGVIRRFVELLTTSSTTGEASVTQALRQFGIDNYQVLRSSYKTDEVSSGVRRNNDDTGAITGSDAGGTVTKTAQSIIPEATAAVNLTDDQYNSFTRNGLTFNITYHRPSEVGRQYNYEVDNYINEQKRVVKALYNWWVPESLDLIQESLGINFSDGRASTNTINLSFVKNGGSTYVNGNWTQIDPVRWTVSDDLGRPSKINMTIDMYYLEGFTEDDKDGTLDAYTNKYNGWCKQLDRYLLNELTELTLRANIPYYTDLPYYITDGLQEIVGGRDEHDGYMTGYYMMRWFAKNYSDGELADTIYAHSSQAYAGNLGDDTFIVTEGTKQTTINTAGGHDTINAFPGDGLLIRGSAYDELIQVNQSSISGTGDIATVYGGRGYDTLIASNGSEVFLYAEGDGNDTINNFNTASDRIRISKGNLSSSSISGNDVIFKIGDGSIRVRNAKDKEITLTNAAGWTTSRVYETEDFVDDTGTTILPVDNIVGGSIYVSDSDAYNGNLGDDTFVVTSGTRNATINTMGGYDTVNAYAGDQLLVAGSARDELIRINNQASISGSGDVATVYGGRGQDTLIGSSGADFFLYTEGDGNDILQNFDPENDRIRITHADIKSSSISGNDVILNVGDGSIRINNARGNAITIINAAGRQASRVYGNEDFTDNTTTSVLPTTVISGSSITVQNNQTSNGNLGNDTFTVASGTSRATINTGGGLDTVNAYAGDGVFVRGSARDDLIQINQALNGGTGYVATVYGGRGNDTLIASDGADMFLYANGNGNDTIESFDATNDRIRLTGADIKSSSVVGSDVVLYVGDGSITLKDAADKSIKIVNAAGRTSAHIYSNEDFTEDAAGLPNDTVSDGYLDNDELPSYVYYGSNRTEIQIRNPFSGTFNAKPYASTVTDINGSKTKKFTTLIGNDNDNKITASKGGSKIYGGGSSNDTLVGGSGPDKFYFGSGDGNDVITKFKPKTDSIQITSGEVVSVEVDSKKNVILHFDEGSLTIQKAAKKDLMITDANGNTKSYNFRYDQSYPLRDDDDDYWYDQLASGKADMWFMVDEDRSMNDDIKTILETPTVDPIGELEFRADSSSLMTLADNPIKVRVRHANKKV